MAPVQAAIFPVNEDLSSLNQLLNDQRVPHRFVEEGDKQILWVDSQASADHVQVILQQLQDGSLDIESLTTHSTGKAWWNGISIDCRPITLCVIILSCVGFIVTQWFYASSYHSFLAFFPLNEAPYAALSKTLASGEVWRLISPIFLHFGLAHLAMNAVFFYFVGHRLEHYLGAALYLVLLLLLALASNLTEYFWSETAYFGGLSGVLLGCFGFAGSVYVKVPNPILEMPRGFYLSVFFGLLIGMSGLLDILFDVKIGNASHLGGLIMGVVLGTFFGDYKIREKNTIEQMTPDREKKEHDKSK